MKRADDYEARRQQLAALSDEELKERFWSSIGQLIDPLLVLAYENTSPSIERSVLLRMGFSSLEAKALVNGCLEHGLLEHGAGNVIYRLAKAKACDYRKAGLMLIEQEGLWAEAEKLFKEADKA